jgi:hypothetical protein
MDPFRRRTDLNAFRLMAEVPLGLDVGLKEFHHEEQAWRRSLFGKWNS